MTCLLASAELASVASVMLVLFSQSARLNLMFKSSKRFSASAINFSASAGVPFVSETEAGFGLVAQDEVSAKIKLTKRKTTAHT